jgi:hypothetical protein
LAGWPIRSAPNSIGAAVPPPRSSVELRLVTRDTWVRRQELPTPIKDPRTLRTLVLLDLESHPPPAGIDAVTLRAEPTPARTLQHSLLERARRRPSRSPRWSHASRR